jgi:predicted MFS family arabinose efflux permease
MLVARALSGAGSWMQTVAAGWLVYDLTASAVAVGLITLASRGPGLVLSAWGGALSDRLDMRRLTIALSLVQAAAAGLLALADLLHDVTVVEVYAATLAIGVAGALSGTSVFQVGVSAVPADERKSAIALNSAAFNWSRLAGPAVGGALTQLVGTGACFALNALSFLSLVVAVLGVPATRMTSSHHRRRIREGIAVARTGVVLRGILVGIVLFSTLVAPVQELAPVIAKRHAEGAVLLGLLLSALAAGSIAGTALRPRATRLAGGRERVLGASMVVCGLGLIGLAATADYVAAVAAMFCIGIFWEVIWVESMVGVTDYSPDEVSGVMLGLFFTLSFGGVSLGALAVGLLIEAAGVGQALALCGAVVAAYGCWAFVRRKLPEHEEGSSAIP